MSFFSKSESSLRYGVLVDVGSASVLVAIIESNSTKVNPEIIWSKREYIPLRDNQNLDNNPKLVMTCLINALMLFDGEGRKVLKETKKVSKLPAVQVSISAPWSKTVTKAVSYVHDEPFRISDELVGELLRTSKTKATEENLHEQTLNIEFDTIFARSVQGLMANGYNLTKPNNQYAKSLEVIESYAWTQDYVKDIIQDSILKILPDSKIQLFPFILVYYYLLYNLQPEEKDYYLVNITFEATEVGVVRDGILKHTAFAPIGAYTLARQITSVLEVPLDEAYSYLNDESPLTELKLYSKDKLAEVEMIFDNYCEALAVLFKDTGDDLSIPKKIYLHDNLETEKFFAEKIERAAKIRTRSSHAVYPVTELLLEILNQEKDKFILNNAKFDTALLLSARFFHTELYQGRFD